MVSGNNRKICEESEAFVNIAQGYCAITNLSFELKSMLGIRCKKKKTYFKIDFFQLPPKSTVYYSNNRIIRKFQAPSVSRNFNKRQARNQEFFREGEFFVELRHFDKQSCTTRERKTPEGKICGFFSWKLLKIAF